MWRGVSKKCGTKYVIKIVRKDMIQKVDMLEDTDINQKLLESKLDVLEEVDHPSITRVFEILEDNENYYVVMELISDGNLLDKLLKLGSIPEDQISKILK